MPDTIMNISNVPYLQDIVLEYSWKTRGLFGLNVLPFVPHEEISGQYQKFSIVESMAVPETLGRPGAPAGSHRVSSEDIAFYIQQHKLREFIPSVQIQNESAQIQTQMRKTRSLTRALYNRMELSIIDKITAYSSFPTANKATLTGTDQFDDTGSKPFNVFDAAKAACIERPNGVVMGWRAGLFLRRHADFIARIQYGTVQNPAVTDDAALARILQVDQAFVAERQYNTGKKKDGDLQYMFPADDILFYYSEPDMPTIDSVTFGYTIKYAPSDAAMVPPALEGIQDGARVRLYNDPNLGEGFYVEPQLYYLPVVASYQCAYYIKNACDPTADIS